MEENQVTPDPEFDERYLIHRNFTAIHEILLHLSLVTRGKDRVYEWNIFAEGLIQKSQLNLSAIRKMITIHSWYSDLDNCVYNDIVDPLSIATLVRSVFESMLAFHHIFINPVNVDEVQLRYLLWVIATMISKDKSDPMHSEEGKAMHQKNRANLEDTVDYILTLEIVNNLDEASKNIIRNKKNPGSKDVWEFYIENEKLNRIESGIHGLAQRIPAKEQIFNNLYKIFSLNCHPTWHSAMLMVNAFELDPHKEPDNWWMVDNMIHFSSVIGAFIIYDYCELFPAVKEAFITTLPDHYKEIVNYYLRAFKGDDYVLPTTID